MNKSSLWGIQYISWSFILFLSRFFLQIFLPHLPMEGFKGINEMQITISYTTVHIEGQRLGIVIKLILLFVQ